MIALGTALHMQVKCHGTVVAHNVILGGTAYNGFVLPVACKFKVRLSQQLPINKNMAFMERNRLARQADDTLHIHHAFARETDGNDVAALWFLTQVGETIDAIDLTGAICRLHGNPLDTDGQQNIFERDEAGDNQHENAHECESWPATNDDHTQPMRPGLVGTLHPLIKARTGEKLRKKYNLCDGGNDY